MSEEKKSKIDTNRRDMPKQSPEMRSHNFNEVALGYTEELAIAEASRCLQCKKPRCKTGCPVEIDIPDFISFIVKGDFRGGIRKLKEKNCLPAVCGRVCPQESQCEVQCILKNKGAEVAIGRLERFLADWEAGQGEVDLPPKAIVAREVEYVGKLGVKVITDFVVGKTRSMDELLEKFDAVFIGTGAGLPWFMDIPGENLNGVYSANEYLTRMNLMQGYKYPLSRTPIRRHKKVAVVGGGNVAMDSARTALRMGAEESRIIYRRSHAELPARLEESENAEEEGVIFNMLTLPVRYIGDENGWLKEIECLKMELGEPDASGRRRPIEIPNSNFRMEMDAVVCAIGNSPNPLVPSTTTGLDTTRHGTIVADPETGKTTRDRVWAGGDIVTGAATVILAMGAGRKAARAIHEYLTTGKQ